MDPAPRSARPLFDATGSRTVDTWAIDRQGIPGISLMVAAARAATRVIRGRFPGARRIAVVAGPGNNGGDGFEVARRLHGDGRAVVIVRVTERDAEGDAATMLAGARAAGVTIADRPDGVIDADLEGADLVVDALLGTGARGAPRGAAERAVAAIVACGVPVVALDVPSGVDASTGEVPGDAVVAEITVSFHVGKVGLWIAPGRDHAGDVIVVPIGIPIGIPPNAPVAPAAVAVRDADPLVPARAPGGSKYDAGAVLVIGGAPGMAGAPSLAATAALRTGAGLVRVAVPDAVRGEVAGWTREAMVHGLGVGGDTQVAVVAERMDAVAVGPGLGREAGADRILDAALALPHPLVIDADALWWLRGDLERLRARSAPTVLTPHAGEAAGLLGVGTDEIAARRLHYAQQMARDGGAVVLLKGADTIVVDPAGRVGIRDGVCPGLATAGSGDVLTGVITALLARGCEAWTAAVAGAAIHLDAGCRAVATRRGGAIMAGDLIEALRVDAHAVERRGGDR